MGGSFLSVFLFVLELKAAVSKHLWIHKPTQRSRTPEQSAVNPPPYHPSIDMSTARPPSEPTGTWGRENWNMVLRALRGQESQTGELRREFRGSEKYGGTFFLELRGCDAGGGLEAQEAP